MNQTDDSDTEVNVRKHDESETERRISYDSSSNRKTDSEDGEKEHSYKTELVLSTQQLLFFGSI